MKILNFVSFLKLKRKLEKEKTKNTNERKSSDDIRLSDEDDDDSSLDSEFPESHNRKKEEEDEEISKFMKKNDGSKKKTINTIGKIEEKSFEMKDIESIRLTRHMIEKIVSFSENFIYTYILSNKKDLATKFRKNSKRLLCQSECFIR